MRLQIHPNHKGWSLSSSSPTQVRWPNVILDHIETARNTLKYQVKYFMRSWSVSWLGKDTKGTGKCLRSWPATCQVDSKNRLSSLSKIWKSVQHQQISNHFNTSSGMFLSCYFVLFHFLKVVPLWCRTPTISQCQRSQWIELYAAAFLRTTGLKCTLDIFFFTLLAPLHFAPE